MRTLTADMFLQQADAICLTTNGATRNDGAAIMGRGNALYAKRCWYGLEKVLGKKLKRRGMRCHVLTRKDEQVPYLKLPRQKDPLITPVPWHIVSFPVKNHWKEDADLKLIEMSCRQLKKMVDKLGWEVVLLPRPGCGNGNLDWKRNVKPVMKKYFEYDDRIVIVHKQEA